MIHLSIYWSIYLSIHRTIDLSIHLTINTIFTSIYLTYKSDLFPLIYIYLIQIYSLHHSSHNLLFYNNVPMDNYPLKSPENTGLLPPVTRHSNPENIVPARHVQPTVRPPEPITVAVPNSVFKITEIPVF